MVEIRFSYLRETRNFCPQALFAFNYRSLDFLYCMHGGLVCLIPSSVLK